MNEMMNEFKNFNMELVNASNVDKELINASYEIVSLSTCVLNDSNVWRFGSESVINITQNLLAETKYEISEGATDDPEIHYFTVKYFRDGKLLDIIVYVKCFYRENFGSLANPDLDKNLKLSLLNDCGPNTISKFNIMNKLLTKEEIEAIVAKSNELKLQTEKTKSR